MTTCLSHASFLPFRFQLDEQKFSVEEFTDVDLPLILDVERRASPWPWSEKNFCDSIASSHICVGVKQDEQWCAHAVFSVAAEEAELLIIAVDPQYQRCGLGRKLLTVMMDEFGKVAREMFLEVRESNTKAIRFYEELGFNCLGQRHNYYPATKQHPREHALIFGIHISSI